MKIQTFGYRYKRDLPLGADIVLDARCLVEDPAEKTQLGQLTGQDEAVRAYLGMLVDVTKFITAALHVSAAKDIKLVAIGCHSGRHWSVYIADQIAAFYKKYNLIVEVEHLDMMREPTEDLAPDVI